MGKSLIGIDINHTELRMVQMGSNPIMAVQRLPEGLVSGDHIAAPEVLSQIIRSMKKENHFKGKKCAIILPDGSSFFRSFNSPPVSADQLRMNLPYEFRDYLRSDSLAYSFDYAVERLNKKDDGELESIDVLAAAAHRDTVMSYADALRRGGLKLSMAIPREMAFIRLLRKIGASPEKARALVEFGYEQSRIYIYKGTHLMASKIVDIGCEHIDRAIANRESIDVYLAASYRETNHQDILSDPVCEEVYRDLALEIMKTFNFFVYENPSVDFEDVCFCGANELTRLREVILEYIQFREHPAADLLPSDCGAIEAAGECLMAVGLAV